MINSPLKTHYTRFIFKLGPTVPLNVLWVFSLDLKYVSILDCKKTFLLKVFFCLSYSPNFYTILGDLFLIRGFIYFMYLFLKLKSISPSFISETRLFLKQGYFFLFFFQFILWTKISTSSSSVQCCSHKHKHVVYLFKAFSRCYFFKILLILYVLIIFQFYNIICFLLDFYSALYIMVLSR